MSATMPIATPIAMMPSPASSSGHEGPLVVDALVAVGAGAAVGTARPCWWLLARAVALAAPERRSSMWLAVPWGARPLQRAAPRSR